MHWIGAALLQLQPQPGMDRMTIGMMVGAGVLVGTQLVMVGIAAVWFVRSQRKTSHPSPSKEATE